MPRCWIMNSGVSFGLRVPSIEEYELIKKTEASVTVKCRGSSKNIRKSSGIEFFFDKDEMLKIYRRRVEKVIECLEGKLRDANESRTPNIYVIPDESPVYKGKLKL